MPEEILELKCCVELAGSPPAPLLIRIEEKKITFLAHINENEKAQQDSLKVVKVFDEFIHRVVLRDFWERCINPEKISFYFGRASNSMHLKGGIMKLQFKDLLVGRFFSLGSGNPRQILLKKISETHAQDMYTQGAKEELIKPDVVVTSILLNPELLIKGD